MFNRRQASYLIFLLVLHALFDKNVFIGVIYAVLLQIGFYHKEELQIDKDTPYVFIGMFLIISLLIMFNQIYLFELFLICLLMMFTDNLFFVIQTISVPVIIYLCFLDYYNLWKFPNLCILYILRHLCLFYMNDKAFMIIPPSLLNARLLTNWAFQNPMFQFFIYKFSFGNINNKTQVVFKNSSESNKPVRKCKIVFYLILQFLVILHSLLVNDRYYCYYFLILMFIKIIEYPYTYFLSCISTRDIKITQRQLIFEYEQDMKSEKFIYDLCLFLPKDIAKIINGYERENYSDVKKS